MTFGMLAAEVPEAGDELDAMAQPRAEPYALPAIKPGITPAKDVYLLEATVLALGRDCQVNLLGPLTVVVPESPRLARLGQKFFERPRNHSVQLLLVRLGEQCGPFVKIGSNADIEAALESLVRRLAFRCAEGNILIHRGTEIGFQAIHVPAFIHHCVADSEQTSVQKAVFCTVLD